MHDIFFDKSDGTGKSKFLQRSEKTSKMADQMEELVNFIPKENIKDVTENVNEKSKHLNLIVSKVEKKIIKVEDVYEITNKTDFKESDQNFSI